MGYYLVTINFIREERKKGKKGHCVLLFSSTRVLILCPRWRMDWLPDERGKSWLTSILHRSAPFWMKRLALTLSSYPREIVTQVRAPRPSWTEVCTSVFQSNFPGKRNFYFESRTSSNFKEKEEKVFWPGILLLIDSLAIRDRILEQKSCSLHNLPPRPREEGIRSM